MTIKFLIPLSVLLFCITSCNTDDDNVKGLFCTEQFVYGLNVSLIDATTLNPITTAIEIIATDGDYEETLITSSSIGSFFGAGEREGTYVITVTSANYQTYVSEPISVSADRCHVIPENIQISLQTE